MTEQRNYPPTLADTLQAWEEQGFTKRFIASDGGLKCPSQDRTFRPHLVRVHDIQRFEGESNPADSTIAFAITASDGMTRGTFVTSHGADTPPEDQKVLKKLPDPR